jgi:2-polyprenyl-3-methyl-5-hydroxy-6-metoxy-1,4-benzoquinol methylase
MYSFSYGNIYMCRACKLQWATKFKKHSMYNNTAILKAHYMLPESTHCPQNYSPYLDFFRFLTTYFDKNRLSNLKVLDVGCGNGVFLKECMRREYNVIGVEMNRAFEKQIPKKVLDKIIFKPIEKIQRFNNSFDLITFWDTFEHIEDSFNVLNKIKLFLKPGGLIYIRVNNNHDIFNHLTLSMLKLFPKAGKKLLEKCFGFMEYGSNHFWNFSEEAMKNLLKQNGWRIIHSSIGETPTSRLTSNCILKVLISFAYLLNKAIGGGKIGNYYIVVG